MLKYMNSPSERFHMSHEERPEYQTADHESLELVTDLIDELLVSREESGAEYAAKSVDMPNYFSIKREYNYLESGMSSGWMWPLTEMTFALSYHRYKNPTHEEYSIVITPTIHQQHIMPPPLQTHYSIEYFGKNRESKPHTRLSSASVDVLGKSRQRWDTRDMTNYDAGRLFDELGHVYDFLQRQADERRRLDNLFTDLA